jgi:hypothetical protein
MTDITFEKYMEGQKRPSQFSGDNKSNISDGVKCVVLSGDRDRNCNNGSILRIGAVGNCPQRNYSYKNYR